jgi:transketolase
MLLYSLLHLAGYDLSLDELKNFRQWGSKTPGHPEYGLTPGVETTTGPLGQGAANAVGMALAEAFLAAKYNREGHTIIDHYTYALVSDGDIMEGVVAEASSLAGHFKLGKLIYLYDDNEVSLAADTSVTFSEDVEKRYQAYGWHVLRVPDGNDTAALEAAIKQARDVSDKPSLLMIRTVIGYGSPNKAGTFEAHGSPLGLDEVALTKAALGWPAEPEFHIDDDVLDFWRQAVEKGEQAESDWQKRWNAYADAHPQLAAELQQAIAGELPEGWDASIPVFEPNEKGEATRNTSGKVINVLAGKIPTFMGGDADLAPSTKNTIKTDKNFSTTDYSQRNIPYGVREHAMGSMTNGMAVHGGIIKPFTATFLTFSDYMRPAMRLAALMEIAPIFIFTHDSIGLGEDGPTHQPVEHFMALRAIPHMVVFRPGDANEVAAAWKTAMTLQHRPTTLIFSRQNTPTYSPEGVMEGVPRGGYIRADSDGEPQVILIATGTELAIAMQAYEQLTADGIAARVVSMPSMELFEEQDKSYRESVLPPSVTARVVIEAGIQRGWEGHLRDGVFIGVGNRFGASAPAEVIYEQYGITVEATVEAAKSQLS